jgi:hypothetical protein
MNVSVAAQQTPQSVLTTSTSEHDHEYYDGHADLAAGTATARHGVFPPSPTSVVNYSHSPPNITTCSHKQLVQLNGQQDDDDDNKNCMGDAYVSASQEDDGHDTHTHYLTPERGHPTRMVSLLQSQASHTTQPNNNTAQTTDHAHAHGRRRRPAGDVYTVADFLRVTTGTGTGDEDEDDGAADELLHHLDRDLTLLSEQWCQSQPCHKQQHQINIQATCNNFLNSDMSPPASPKGRDKQFSMTNTNIASLNPDFAKLEAQAIHFMAALDAAALALENNLDDYDETHLPRAGDYIHDYIYDYIYDDDDDDNNDDDDDEMEDEWNTLHRKERQVEHQMLEAERLTRAQLLLQETSLLQAQAHYDAVSESQSQLPDDDEEEEEEGAQVSSSNLQDSVAVSSSRRQTHRTVVMIILMTCVDRITSSARSLRLQRKYQDAQEEETQLDQTTDVRPGPTLTGTNPTHTVQPIPGGTRRLSSNQMVQLRGHGWYCAVAHYRLAQLLCPCN